MTGASSEKSAAASALKKRVEESGARGLRVVERQTQRGRRANERERERGGVGHAAESGNDRDSRPAFEFFIDILKGGRIMPADIRNNYCLARLASLTDRRVS